MALTVESDDLRPAKMISNKFVFNGFGCSGKNQSPDIRWSGLPAGTKSVAVTVYDPSAPTGSGFWHWVVVNIPATTKGLEAGWKNEGSGGTAIINDYGSAEYGGPCPPEGSAHTYVFTVHALKIDKIGTDVTNAVARFMIEANTIEKSQLLVSYGRETKENKHTEQETAP